MANITTVFGITYKTQLAAAKAYDLKKKEYNYLCKIGRKKEGFGPALEEYVTKKNLVLVTDISKMKNVDTWKDEFQEIWTPVEEAVLRLGVDNGWTNEKIHSVIPNHTVKGIHLYRCINKVGVEYESDFTEREKREIIRKKKIINKDILRSLMVLFDDPQDYILRLANEEGVTVIM